MKLEYALVVMEGSALHCLQWLMRRLPTLSWRRFTVELLKQYGDDPRSTPCEVLVSTRQTSSVNDYVNVFISKLAVVPLLSESDALGMFLHGLRKDIRVRIRSKDAVDISTTMHLARKIERELAYDQLQDFPPPAHVPPFFANRPAVQQGYPRSNGIVAAKTTPLGLMSSHDTVNHSEAAPLGHKLGGQNLTYEALTRVRTRQRAFLENSRHGCGGDTVNFI
ncbi:hypothetical protein OROGR_030308 [Orobanche gracilis]